MVSPYEDMWISASHLLYRYVNMVVDFHPLDRILLYPYLDENPFGQVSLKPITNLDI